MKEKQSLKERLIKVIMTDINKWNRYQRFIISKPIDSYIDLTNTNFCGVNFCYANLHNVNFTGSNLKYANLCHANLTNAILTDVDLDFSCLPLSCKSLKFKSSLRIRTQIGFHFAALIAADQENASDEEKDIYNKILGYVNKFHRTDIEKLIQL